MESLILSHLLTNEQFARRVLPHLKPEYFQEKSDGVIFELVDEFVGKYNAFPSKEALEVELESKTGLTEDVFKDAVERIESLQGDSVTSVDWLVDQTEKHCQQRAVIMAINEAIRILDDSDDQKRMPTAIPSILEKALAVSFESKVGHDYFEDVADRYAFYHEDKKKIPFELEYMNKITRGGLETKTLTGILAGVNVGKSLVMCAWAAGNLRMGNNVLYITMEMSEEKISERIDANLMDTEIDDLYNLSRTAFLSKMEKVRSTVKGKLIVKEYPTASASPAHFRALLNELKTKKGFVPDIIYVDYLGICTSARFKNASNVNSYSYVKAIAEELRGLAVEFDVPIVTATQATRAGSQSSDPDMTDTAESFGLPATLDLFISVSQTEELEELGQYMFKQLKNRFADRAKHRKFYVGVYKAKMQLFDVDDEFEPEDDKPVFDKSKFGTKDGSKKRNFSGVI